jgi:hypothetical protein
MGLVGKLTGNEGEIMVWSNEKPVEPGWYWYRDTSAGIGPVVLHVDHNRLAYGRNCDGAEIEQMPGEWSSERLREPY